jgi:hypothetical protein
MSNSSSSLSSTLEKWYEAKEKMAKLEDKINNYKSIVTKELNKNNTDTVTSGGFTVNRRRNTKTYLSKDSVPENVWKQYSVKCSFDSLYLSKKG